MNEYVVGIDIGSSKVCAAAGKLDKYGEIQIKGITSVSCNGMKKGIVVDIDNTAESIKKSIEQLEGMIDYKITDAYIAIPSEICELTLNRGVVAVSSDDREIKESDVERVLKAAKIITISSDKEIIGVIPEQFIVDGYDNIMDPIGMSGVRLEVDAQIILSQSTVVSNIFKSIKRSHINVKGMVFQPLATANAVLKDEEIKIGTALLDVGAESTSITVFKDGRLIFTDVIPLGGNTITNDISVCLKLPFSESEKLKIKYGNVNYDDSKKDFKIKIDTNYNNVVEVNYSILSQIIKARVEEIVYLIKKKLITCGQLDEVSGMVIGGGGIALIKGISDLCKDILDKPVKISYPEYGGVTSPVYVPVIGIVKDVIESGKVKLSKSNVSTDNHESDYTSTHNKRDEDYSDEEKGNGVLTKIKEFFTDFF